ncbi:MAG: ribosome-associated translation inhibitor RaiA [Calditrichaeota bacterium]|nr:ribosome-associated translation inhibitor RaiA [Calditrichota bacterium]
MKVTFSARHFDATEKLRLFATKEIERLKRYFDGNLNADVILEENGNVKSVELRLTMLGKLLPSRVEGADFYKLIPQAVDKLEKQVKSTKEKVYFNR